MTADNTAGPSSTPLVHSAVEFAKQSQKLSHKNPEDDNSQNVAAQALFVTPRDPVIATAEGHRLPGVPLEEAQKLNTLRERLEQDQPAASQASTNGSAHQDPDVEAQNSHNVSESNKAFTAPPVPNGKSLQKTSDGSLRRAMPPSHTNPLFPPLPLYGPSSIMRDIHCAAFRVSSFFLSLSFLGVIVLGSLFTSIPLVAWRMWYRLTFRNPDKERPFYEEEVSRRDARKEQERQWKHHASEERRLTDNDSVVSYNGYIPTEGGPDPIKCDVSYYARRVGLDVEEFEVQTEDGFIIDLWHVYDPREYVELDPKERQPRGPDPFTGGKRRGRALKDPEARRKYPVLLMHGLLQSAGAYCVNDDQSLAFWLCKSGYDVWLGNNRCGFKPKHVLLEYSDPRMWCWNIRQMGIFDLPALTSRVQYETGFSKIGLVAHSQGTTETFVALAKEQRPELGEKLSVFCALAPAAYAGPLIGKMYFKFMRVITPAMFRMIFGIHAFIPIMMTAHKLLPARLYGWMGYKVFSFLFDWTDTRWDRGLRNRFFQFAPVYVSAESMRWWLGRECFAKHKCILSTKEEWRAEEREDEDESQNPVAAVPLEVHTSEPGSPNQTRHHHRRPKGSSAWYNSQSPPMALWVCGRDDLVDGDKLLRRFERGREPHARLVFSKVIPEYEHLDVIWAMDAEREVFQELRETLWRTCPPDERAKCRVPKGCEEVGQWVDDRQQGEGPSNDRTRADNEGAQDSSGDSPSSSEELSTE
ncbi:hypothetical protein DHEL01_v206228 [Diaporthe helianthi]|uniref:Partial AB-hydrolase lipase domain-containing protein n=1 Tax=Diaporthe helianthi TaxID=158607 RepID=A0A2P5HYP9_DIAHE|nr:hypothetical protein DHEL01_v206228 [Diaporthe helianthi]